jgi:hypothetical protein
MLDERVRLWLLLIFTLVLPIVWAICLTLAARFMPDWLFKGDWWTNYILPVLLLGSAACLLVRPWLLGTVLALVYIPLAYILLIGISLAVCVTAFGVCK